MSTSGTGGARTDATWFRTHLRRRACPLILVLVAAAIGMVFTLTWDPVVHHVSSWDVPGDVWSTFRAAHWVGWGDVGGVYDPDTQLVTLPGIAVLLAPVAVLSGHLNLTESLAPIMLTHPTAWLLLGPAVLLIGYAALVPLDATADDLGTDRWLRMVLVAFEAAVLFQVLAIWGHPEDVVALGLALYAILATFRNRWSLAGWLWGAALVVQPLVVVMLAVSFHRVPRGQRIRTCLFALLPSVVLVAPALRSNWSGTTAVFLHQKNFPHLDHATPWMVVAPKLAGNAVGAGPGRILAVVAAVILGGAAYRWRPTLAGLVWLCALVLSLRCVFESVMVPFYLGPPLAVIVLAAAATNRWWRMIGAFTIAMVATELSYRHTSEWSYWLPMTALLALGLVFAWPGIDAVRSASASEESEQPTRSLHQVPLATPAG